MKSTLKVTDNFQALATALRELTSRKLMVGIPSDADPDKFDVQGNEQRQPYQPGEPKPEFNNAAIGYIAEHGSPINNIPARPWLAPGFEGARDQVEAYMQAAAKSALEGDLAAVDQNLHKAGIVATNSIRMKIRSGPFVPLRPRTLAARRSRGHQGTRPLIETSAFLQSIGYVIRKTR
jgi:hypothetical protein